MDKHGQSLPIHNLYTAQYTNLVVHGFITSQGLHQLAHVGACSNGMVTITMETGRADAGFFDVYAV